MRTLRSVSVSGGLAALASSLMFVVGCAGAGNHQPVSSPDIFAATVRGPIRGSVATAREHVTLAPIADLRKPGDFVVHRFTGSFHKTPLRLSQKVIAVAGSMVTIEIALAPENAGKVDEAHASRLRVVFDRTPGATREVAQVTRVFNGANASTEEPGTVEDYEKLMAETIVVPDRNVDELGSEVVTASVGQTSVDCMKTSYRVAIGKKTAVMSTLTHEGFAWGDVGGEIKTDDGKLLYRAEVVEAGDQSTATASASR